MSEFRRRLMMQMKPKGHNLPSAYQEVSYISNEGHTGVLINTTYQSFGNRTFVWDIQSQLETSERFFGSDGGHQVAYKDKYGIGPSPRTTIPIDITKRQIISVSTDSTNMIVTIMGGGYSATAKWASVYSNPISIFGLSKINIAGVQKFYELKVYENNVLIAHLIPCYRKSDNRKGCYNIIANAFYLANRDLEIGELIN